MENQVYFTVNSTFTKPVYREYWKRATKNLPRTKFVKGFRITITAFFGLSLLISLVSFCITRETSSLSHSIICVAGLLWTLFFEKVRISLAYRRVKVRNPECNIRLRFTDNGVEDSSAYAVSVFPYKNIKEIYVTQNLYLLLLRNDKKGVLSIIVPIDDIRGEGSFPVFLAEKCPGIQIG